jgi:serine/threonine protein kinase
VTKLVQGESLQAWLREHRPTWGESARIVAAIAEALSYAHRSGVVHRDVKPSNILLSENNEPILIDFGLGISMSQADLPVLGAVVGTPAYMSPEQIRGERVDGRADIYSLGVVLYEMLCGRQPFADSNVWVRLRRVRAEEPPPPRQVVPQIPRDLEAICLKAMAKRMMERYTTAADLATDLRQFLEGSPIAAAKRVAWRPLVLVALLASAILAGLLWRLFF